MPKSRIVCTLTLVTCLILPFQAHARSVHKSIDSGISTPRVPVGELSCRRGFSTYSVVGTVVGTKTTLLTVAHFSEDRFLHQGARLRSCTFSLFNEHGLASFRSGVSVISRPAISQDWGGALDWAVLRLEKPAPVLPADYMPITPSLKFEQKSLIYLERSKGRRFVKSAGQCSVSRARSNSIVLRHDCPSWRGTSGAPLLAHTSDGYKIFGIQSKVGGYAVGLSGWPLTNLRSAIAENDLGL